MTPRGAKMGPKGPNLGQKGAKRDPNNSKNGCSKKGLGPKIFYTKLQIWIGPFFGEKVAFLVNFGGHFGDLFPSKMKIKINTEIGIKKT